MRRGTARAYRRSPGRATSRQRSACSSSFTEGGAGEHFRLLGQERFMASFGHGCLSLESFRAALCTDAMAEAVVEVMRVCGPKLALL